MKNYINQIEKNYDIVYDHFKEQDQLRNTGFGFFTTLTVAVMSFLDKEKQTISLLIIFGAMFILGFLFSLLLCRYKYYGNIYSITMKVLRRLYNCDERMSEKKRNDIIEDTIKEKAGSIKPKFYSADFLIYLCLIIINCLNLIMVINQIKQYLSINTALFVILILIYVIASIFLYDLLVIKKSRKCKAKQLSFIDGFYVTENNNNSESRQSKTESGK